MTDEDDKTAEVVKIDTDEGVSIDLGETEKTPAEAAKPPEKEPEPKPDERETALEDLRRQLRQSEIAAQHERQAREQAEQFAIQQAQYAQAAQSETEGANLRTLVNAIDATEQIAAAAERAYADAMQAGDYTQAAKAQRAMAQAESQLLRLNEGKSAIEGRQKQPQPPPKPPIQPTQPPKRDPIEELAANLTPKSAEWLRAHPQAAEHVPRLTAAHAAAINLEGLAVESPEYFAFIEQKLGIAEEKPAQKSPSKPALASAPVSGGGSVGSRVGGGSSMHLSAAEVEVAVLMNPDLPRDQALRQYAENKRELIRLGKMSA